MIIIPKLISTLVLLVIISLLFPIILIIQQKVLTIQNQLKIMILLVCFQDKGAILLVLLR